MEGNNLKNTSFYNKGQISTCEFGKDKLNGEQNLKFSSLGIKMAVVFVLIIECAVNSILLSRIFGYSDQGFSNKKIKFIYIFIPCLFLLGYIDEGVSLELLISVSLTQYYVICCLLYNCAFSS